MLGGCLQANPEKRLNISSVLERIAAIAETNGYNLRTPLVFDSISNNNCNSEPSPQHQPARPPPPQTQQKVSKEKVKTKGIVKILEF